MQELQIKEIYIGDKVVDEIIDSEGIKWYPFKHILQRVLCKYDKISKFRDSNVVKYMCVIEYAVNKNAPNTLIKTWCINEDGVKFLLKRMNIFQKRNKNINLYRAREKGFFEACIYFKVKPPEKLEPMYINTPPKLDKYDIWSIMCLEHDYKLKINDRWKKCTECGYYYPDKVGYYGENAQKQKKCLQCQGKNFKCRNDIVQYIYDHDGLDLLYKLYLNDDTGVTNELIKLINKGVQNTNEN